MKMYTRDYDEILNNKEIDIVDIITEPDRHIELAIQAVKHGKHVLIEKPLDIDLGLSLELLKEKRRGTHTKLLSPKGVSYPIES